jgi:hypothetical protein
MLKQNSICLIRTNTIENKIQGEKRRSIISDTVSLQTGN